MEGFFLFIAKMINFKLWGIPLSEWADYLDDFLKSLFVILLLIPGDQPEKFIKEKIMPYVERFSRKKKKKK